MPKRAVSTSAAKSPRTERCARAFPRAVNMPAAEAALATIRVAASGKARAAVAPAPAPGLPTAAADALTAGHARHAGSRDRVGRDFPGHERPPFVKQFLSTAPRANFRATYMAASPSRQSGAFGIIPVREGGALLPQRVRQLLLARTRPVRGPTGPNQ